VVLIRQRHRQTIRQTDGGAEIAELDIARPVHCAQAIIKRTDKIALKEEYGSDEDDVLDSRTSFSVW